MADDLLPRTIEIFGQMSDDSLDRRATKACREFDPDKHDAVIFLRNLRDLAVRYSWGSGAILNSITAVLDTAGAEPEDPGEMLARRNMLEMLERGPVDLERMLHAKPEPPFPHVEPPKPREPVVPKMTPKEAIEEARKRSDNGDRAIDIIFNVFDDHFLAGDFDSVNACLRDLDPNTLPLTLRISVLTITLSAKIKLPYRAGFYERVKASIKGESAERRKRLIGGLA